jgi:hypothetical protein
MASAYRLTKIKPKSHHNRFTFQSVTNSRNGIELLSCRPELCWVAATFKDIRNPEHRGSHFCRFGVMQFDDAVRIPYGVTEPTTGLFV